MKSVFRLIQLSVLCVLFQVTGFSQTSHSDFKFRIVSSETFDDVRDSLKHVRDLYYSFDKIACIGLTRETARNVVGCLRNGMRPPGDYGGSKFMVYCEIFFAPWPPVKEWRQVVVNFSLVDDPSMECLELSEIRILSGVELDSHPLYEVWVRDQMQDESPERDSCSFYWLKDTTFSNGSYLHYSKTETDLSISWGSDHFMRIFPETFDCGDHELAIPDFRWASDEFIGLEYSCGSPCWASCILPLNPDDSIQFIWYPVDINLETNTLAHIDEERRDKLILTQLDSGESREVILDENCASEGIGACLKNVRLTNDELFIEYADWVNAAPLSIHLVY